MPLDAVARPDGEKPQLALASVGAGVKAVLRRRDLVPGEKVEGHVFDDVGHGRAPPEIDWIGRSSNAAWWPEESQSRPNERA